MKRGAAVAVVCLAVLLVATMATPALAAVAPSESGPSPQVNGSDVSSGPFDLNDLRRGGTQPSAAPPSVRYVGDPDGAVAVPNVRDRGRPLRGRGPARPARGARVARAAGVSVVSVLNRSDTHGDGDHARFRRANSYQP